MSFRKIRSWDNRGETKQKRLLTINGRTWTRRVIQLEDLEGTVKLKFDIDSNYCEYIVPPAFVQTVWDRFCEGQSVEDAISILGTVPPPALRSRKVKT